MWDPGKSDRLIAARRVWGTGSFSSIQRGRQAHPVFLFTTQLIEPEAAPREDRARPQLEFPKDQSPLPIRLLTRTSQLPPDTIHTQTINDGGTVDNAL